MIGKKRRDAVEAVQPVTDVDAVVPLQTDTSPPKRKRRRGCGCLGIAALVAIVVVVLISVQSGSDDGGDDSDDPTQIQVARSEPDAEGDDGNSAVERTNAADRADMGDPGYSPGLGQSRGEWEDGHGEPNDEFSAPPMYYYGEGPRSYITVTFIDGNAQSLSFDQGDPSISDAETAAAVNTPDDAVFIEEYYNDPTLLVRVYRSESLAGRFGPIEGVAGDWWFGEPPGTFIVAFRFVQEGGLIQSWFTSTGNNP